MSKFLLCHPISLYFLYATLTSLYYRPKTQSTPFYLVPFLTVTVEPILYLHLAGPSSQSPPTKTVEGTGRSITSYPQGLPKKQHLSRSDIKWQTEHIFLVEKPSRQRFQVWANEIGTTKKQIRETFGNRGLEMEPKECPQSREHIWQLSILNVLIQ